MRDATYAEDCIDAAAASGERRVHVANTAGSVRRLDAPAAPVTTWAQLQEGMPLVRGAATNPNPRTHMTRKAIISALCLTLLTTAGCVGMRSANGYYTVHAESFRIFGFAIPGDDQEAAAKLAAEKFPGSNVTTSGSTPADWTSFWGVLGNILSFHCTTISGKTSS